MHRLYKIPIGLGRPIFSKSLFSFEKIASSPRWVSTKSTKTEKSTPKFSAVFANAAKGLIPEQFEPDEPPQVLLKPASSVLPAWEPTSTPGGPITKTQQKRLVRLLKSMLKSPEVRAKALECGINARLFKRAVLPFRDFVLSNPSGMPPFLSHDIEEGVQLKQLFAMFLTYCESNFGEEVAALRHLHTITDMRTPHTWYPVARRRGQRKVVFHCGPTNSGKSYHALNALASAKSGLYLGPLRLLALEGFEKLNARGIKCSLITGEEQILSEGSKHASSTVEMCNLAEPVDVAVIDEVQMLGDSDRGWAWTRALLGVPADEVHVCGEERALPLLKHLCSELGESVEVQKYERLSPLRVADNSLRGSLRNLKRGDCVVAFSRREIFRLKSMIESETDLSCTVVYGGLPPEIRSSQAKLYNTADGSGADVLVASDAIAFGLNLNIERLIFSSMEKFDGEEMKPLPLPLVRQIAGRAGRFNPNKESNPGGMVTCLHETDMTRLREALSEQSPPSLTAAGLAPTFEQIERFALQFPDARLSKLLDRFIEMSRLDGHFFVCNYEDRKTLADHLEEIPLTLEERYIFTMAPVDINDQLSMAAVLEYARQHSAGNFVPLGMSLPQHTRVPRTINELRDLESIHSVIGLYNWLSYRFPDTFQDTEAADQLEARCLELIDKALKSPDLFSEKRERSKSPPTRRRRSEGAYSLDEWQGEEEERMRRRLQHAKQRREMYRRLLASEEEWADEGLRTSDDESTSRRPRSKK